MSEYIITKDKVSRAFDRVAADNDNNVHMRLTAKGWDVVVEVLNTASTTFDERDEIPFDEFGGRLIHAYSKAATPINDEWETERLARFLARFIGYLV